jgi:hypothetical protein
MEDTYLATTRVPISHTRGSWHVGELPQLDGIHVRAQVPWIHHSALKEVGLMPPFFSYPPSLLSLLGRIVNGQHHSPRYGRCSVRGSDLGLCYRRRWYSGSRDGIKVSSIVDLFSSCERYSLTPRLSENQAFRVAVIEAGLDESNNTAITLAGPSFMLKIWLCIVT